MLVLCGFLGPVARDCRNAFWFMDQDRQTLRTNRVFVSDVFQAQERDLFTRAIAIQTMFDHIFLQWIYLSEKALEHELKQEQDRR